MSSSRGRRHNFQCAYPIEVEDSSAIFLILGGFFAEKERHLALPSFARTTMVHRPSCPQRVKNTVYRLRSTLPATTNDMKPRCRQFMLSIDGYNWRQSHIPYAASPGPNCAPHQEIQGLSKTIKATPPFEGSHYIYLISGMTFSDAIKGPDD